jgi:hypothetical protein
MKTESREGLFLSRGRRESPPERRRTGANRSRRRGLLIGFVCLLLLLSGVLGGFARTANASGMSVENVGTRPSLMDVSRSSSPEQLVVDGQGFTPGGQVYLAIYDQAGAQLYEHRSVRATAALTKVTDPVALVPGGAFRATFKGLCGASAMMRAEDVSTGVWSDWLTVAPNCPASAAEIADDLDVSLRLPTANNIPSAAMIAGSADGALADPPVLFDATGAATGPGMVTFDGQGFTAGGRVYIAVYDQMGAKLYETRWVRATATTGGTAQDVPALVTREPDGRFIAAFAGISGAKVMIRAYDASTETWSNWVVPSGS